MNGNSVVVRHPSGIRYVCDQTYETLAAAEAAVVTSGTATLETALLNVPEVVVYRTLWFQVKLQPYVLKVPYVSLVNLNLGRESVVEIIQSDLDITRAERELRGSPSARSSPLWLGAATWWEPEALRSGTRWKT